MSKWRRQSALMTGWWEKRSKPNCVWRTAQVTRRCVTNKVYALADGNVRAAATWSSCHPASQLSNNVRNNVYIQLGTMQSAGVLTCGIERHAFRFRFFNKFAKWCGKRFECPFSKITIRWTRFSNSKIAWEFVHQIQKCLLRKMVVPCAKWAQQADIDYESEHLSEKPVHTRITTMPIYPGPIFPKTLST